MAEETEIQIRRQIDTDKMIWPQKGDAPQGGWINRDYVDMRGCSWREAREILQFEEELLQRVRTRLSDEEVDLNSLVSDEEYEDLCLSGWGGLDIGVAAAVIALSAAGCIPVSSCNGSMGHHENYPVIVFRSKPGWIPALLEAAEDSRCGLVNSEVGTVAVYSPSVLDLVAFASALISRRPIFAELRKGAAWSSRQVSAQ